MIKVYGKVGCTKCVSLKDKLSADNVAFEYIEDLRTLMIVGSKAQIMSAPIVEYNNKFYTMEEFLEVL